MYRRREGGRSQGRSRRKEEGEMRKEEGGR
jgi:hypothetical protein